MELFAGITRRAAKVGDMGQMAQPVPIMTAATIGRILPPTPRATAFTLKQTPMMTPRAPPATPGAIAASRLLEAASGTKSLGGVGLMSPRLKPRAASTVTATLMTAASERKTLDTSNLKQASIALLLSPSLASLGGGGGEGNGGGDGADGGDKGGRPTRRRGASGSAKISATAALSSIILLEAPIAVVPIAVGWASVSAPKVETGGENVVPIEKILKGGRGSRVSSRAASASKD